MSDWELRTTHPFPIRNEDVLFVASFSDGWVDDPIDWQIRIANYGLLVQRVTFYGRRDPDEEEYITELSDESCESLLAKASEIGFASLAEKYHGVTDFPILTIGVRLSDGTLKRVMLECTVSREGQAAVDEGHFFELWDMIHVHAPYKYPKRNNEPTRNKRQLKMDARRKRRQIKKQGPSESGPIEDEEGQ